LGSTDEKLSSPREKKLFLLRKLADEYEVSISVQWQQNNWVVQLQFATGGRNHLNLPGTTRLWVYVAVMFHRNAKMGCDSFIEIKHSSVPISVSTCSLKNWESPTQAKNVEILSVGAVQYDGDYRSANRLHQERLLGKMVHDPDIWFEYGCYCMRVWSIAFILFSIWELLLGSLNRS
jgi:hypothetical protein